MLIFSTYFIIAFILILANSIPVFASSRTRRFAKVPSLYFLLLVAAFLVLRVIGFLTYDMSSTQLKQHDNSYDIKKIRGKIYTKFDSKKEKITFESENEIDSEQKKFYENSSYILKFATVQALFVVILAGLGIKKFEHRKMYYSPIIRNHTIYFALCTILDIFVF